MKVKEYKCLFFEKKKKTLELQEIRGSKLLWKITIWSF